MKFRHLIPTAVVAVLSIAAQAATFVVPAAGTGAGANNSQWQSELTLHTAAPRAVTLSVSFHQGTAVFGPVKIMLQPRETFSIADVVRTKFDVSGGSGALTIDVADRDASSLAVTSRTLNVSPDGEFGQDIPSIAAADALRPGDLGTITGPSSVASTRFNFGVYATEAATVKWELIRANGTVGGTKEVIYAAGQHAQYNSGVTALFGAAAENNDTIHARILSGRAIFYGSAINTTGDPTFIPGVRTREDIVIQFAGVDLDENGTVDLADANQDGVLDTPIVVVTSLYANYFNVVAAGEFGEPVSLEIVSTPTQTDILDSHTLRVAAAGDVKGRTGEIVLRATSGSSSSTLTIPVIFK